MPCKRSLASTRASYNAQPVLCTRAPVKRTRRASGRTASPARPIGVDADLDNKLGVASHRIYASMLELERNNNFTVNTNAPMTELKQLRNWVVGVLADVVREVRICRGALHLAVRTCACDTLPLPHPDRVAGVCSDVCQQYWRRERRLTDTCCIWLGLPIFFTGGVLGQAS